MAIMDGLATYEIWKTGFISLILICCLCCAISFTIRNLYLNYQSTPGIIKVNDDKITQTLTYTVNDVKYTKIIKSGNNKIKNNSSNNSELPLYDGVCTVYYAKSDPNTYIIDLNPTFVSELITCILCIITVLSLITFYFLRKNRYTAGIVGAVDVASSVSNLFYNKY